MPATPCSQFDRFLQHGLAQVAAEFMFGNQIEPAAGDLGQTFGERQALGKQVVAARKIHQEIDVAVGSFLAARDRAEHANAARAVLAAGRVDGVFSCAQRVEQHGRDLMAR